MRYTLGFMQGRLSPLVSGRIQAFPCEHWEQEFLLAQAHGWQVMEWTIDQTGFEENPVMTPAGRVRIQNLMRQYHITIPSATADFIMEAPFYKVTGSTQSALLDQLHRFLVNAASIGIKQIVVPLVDNGALKNDKEETALRKGLSTLENILRTQQQTIVFESDFEPGRLAHFIASFPETLFGVNYDTGNSASLGYMVQEEFAAYGRFIKNVHIKDRVYQGTTVPLGTGNTDFAGVFTQLAVMGYDGNLIFQTARASDENHVGVLNGYRDFITRKIMS